MWVFPQMGVYRENPRNMDDDCLRNHHVYSMSPIFRPTILGMRTPCHPFSGIPNERNNLHGPPPPQMWRHSTSSCGNRLRCQKINQRPLGLNKSSYIGGFFKWGIPFKHHPKPLLSKMPRCHFKSQNLDDLGIPPWLWKPPFWGRAKHRIQIYHVSKKNSPGNK